MDSTACGQPKNITRPRCVSQGPCYRWVLLWDLAQTRMDWTSISLRRTEQLDWGESAHEIANDAFNPPRWHVDLLASCEQVENQLTLFVYQARPPRSTGPHVFVKTMIV